MIRRVVGTAVSFLLFAALPLAAQTPVGVFIGGGLLVPVMDYADHHDAGFAAGAGVHFAIGDDGLGLFGEGFYGSSNFAPEEAGGDEEKQSMFGGFLGATYRLGDASEKGFFLLGKGGVLIRDSDAEVGDDERETKLAGGAGLGYIIPGETASPWILAQFIVAKCTKFLVFSVGFTFGGGDSQEGNPQG
ncbi:MAG: outer membrane beta-barrel protein [Gemmatimonadetes bacterium]|nr:outer membrane beta-barrel protein [Gemmatimonadota bacterium]NNM03579.1 outer membrane beta-barrel protein [Gemmatimonadota bacterium]